MNMKNGAFLILIFLAISAPLAAQTEEPIKESVSVVNVEVPVRVFAGGQSVSGLGKSDFAIFEDGKPQQINGFYAFHKKISADNTVTGETSAQPAFAGRYFILVFRTYEYNEQLQRGLQYLFDNIFRPQDQLLVMANNRILAISQLSAEADAQSKIQELLSAESLAARNLMLNYLHSIEQSLNMTQFRMKLKMRADTKMSKDDLSPDYLTNFLQSYLKAWQDFKRRFLSLDLDRFYYFSQHLEHVKKEKWVLNFYQLEQFPQIALGSEIERLLRTYVGTLEESENPTLIAQGRIIEKLLQTIDMEMKVTKDFPAEEASKLFYKVNATFHSFFMRSFFDSGNPDLEFKSVATDMENSLRSLTETTGGSLTASNRIDEALASVSEKIDDYYVLTYEPANANKIGKIKVTVGDNKYKVLYDNNIRADYINEYLKKKAVENPSVKITELSFQDRKLSLVISDFSLVKVKGETTGVLLVRIRIKDAQGQSFFDQGKSLQTARKTFSLALSFNSLPPGKYDIIIDVLDQVSNKTCTEVIQPLIQ